MSSCLVCHRVLKKEPSLSRGIGPACAKKVRGLAGLSGTGGKTFSVVGDDHWEKLIADHVAIRNREEMWSEVAKPLRLEPEGSRIVAEKIGEYAVHGTKITNQKDLATMFQDLAQSDREKCFVACCDDEGNVIGTQCVSVGSLDASYVIPKDVLKVPFLLGAKKFYLLHNHPSGNATPSNDDIAVTKRISAAAESLGIGFEGHAVIGNGEYSFIRPNGQEDRRLPMEMDKRADHIPQYDTLQRQGEVQKSKFSNKNDVAQYAIGHVFREDKKGVFLIVTNTQNETVAVSPFSYDDPMQNTRALVMGNAARCFLVADEEVDREKFIQQTKQFANAAEVLHAPVTDAIHVNGNEWFSMRENRVIE